MQRRAMEQRKTFQTVTQYPFDSTQVRDIFYADARAEAIRIVEQERRNCVAERANSIKTDLNIALKKLQILVMTPKGKGTLYVKKQFFHKEGDAFAMEERDVTYFEDETIGYEIANHIGMAKTILGQYNEYYRYMDAELTKLYDTAYDLGNLPIVRLDNATTQTQTETSKAEETKGE